MPTFEITAPDGRVFEVTGPEGSTAEQALAQVQAQYGQKPEQPTILQNVGRVGLGLARGGLGGATAEMGRQTLRGLERAGDAAGGFVTDEAAKVLPPEVAGALGTVASMVPGAIAGGGAGTALRVAPQKAAESLMHSALKPSMKAMKIGKGDQAIKTLLDEGTIISKRGVEGLQGKVDALSAAISNALKGSGAKVDKGAVASRLQDVIGRIEKTSLTPQDRVSEVEKIYTQVLSNPNIEKSIPVEQAQQIKQGIYALLKKEYGKLGSDSVEANKALARGLKEEMGEAVPAIKGLNAQESKLINALELAEHRAIQTRNKDVGGLAWLIENPLRFAAFMADRSPAFKSAVAQLIDKSAKRSGSLGAAGGTAIPQEQP